MHRSFMHLTFIAVISVVITHLPAAVTYNNDPGLRDLGERIANALKDNKSNDFVAAWIGGETHASILKKIPADVDAPTAERWKQIRVELRKVKEDARKFAQEFTRRVFVSSVTPSTISLRGVRGTTETWPSGLEVCRNLQIDIAYGRSRTATVSAGPAVKLEKGWFFVGPPSREVQLSREGEGEGSKTVTIE